MTRADDGPWTADHSDRLGRLGVVQHNATGDVTKEFDCLAEQRIIEYCARAIPEPIRILTEERGAVLGGSDGRGGRAF